MSRPRELSDWLDAYMEYTNETEPATIFHKWVGFSALASALRKKTYLSLGRIKVYGNMYIVLVAEPGIARKSQAINFGLQIMSEVPEIQTSADAVTKEALLQDLENSAQQDQLLDGSTLTHSSLSIISKEFESFLGQKKENTKMLVLLTDLFDCQELPWKYRTKNSGNNTIPSIYLNLMGATTPESLASCLPSTAIGGGLTSRILFIWADRRAKKCSRPEESPRVLELKKKLPADLYSISRIVGQYDFSNEAGKKWDEWYNAYEELDPDRLCKDPAFNGWYSRKPMYLLKVALACAASESDRRILEWRHIERAMLEIQEVEKSMGIVFKAIGKSSVTSEVDTVMQLIRTRKYVTEKDLLSMVWRDLDSDKFDNVITTAIRTGKVKRQFRGPNGETGEIWYVDSDWLASRGKRLPESTKILPPESKKKGGDKHGS